MSNTTQFDAWRAGRMTTALLLLALPLAALGALRLAPPMSLDGSPVLSWSAPIAAVVVATLAIASMLSALTEGLRGGAASAILNAAGYGVLGGTYAIEAIAGPSSAAWVPSAASAIGVTLATVLLLIAAVLGARGTRIGEHHRQAIALIGVFAVTDLAIGLVALGMSGDVRRPEEMALRLAAASVLGATAVLDSRHARHAMAPALLAIGTLTLAGARIGSVDVLLGLATLAGGLAVFIGQQLGAGSLARPTVEADDPTSAPSARQPEERSAFERLTRELYGTIDELIQARRTVQLQRTELDRATTVDELTGVGSRRSILERLRFETAEARRYEHPVAVLLLDIDGLGGINRDHGLAIGDAVLREVALRLRLRVREADAVGRAGGDGFLAILPHTDERGAAVFADTLRRRLGHREIVTDAGALNATVSIGVAIVRPGADLTDEDVLANASEALASARAAGGDRIAFDRAHGLARIEERREAHRSGDGAMGDAAQDSGA